MSEGDAAEQMFKATAKFTYQNSDDGEISTPHYGYA